MQRLDFDAEKRRGRAFFSVFRFYFGLAQHKPALNWRTGDSMMNEQTARSVTAFARRLVRPAAAVSSPTTVHARYPFSDEEPALSEAEVMMARYGMRPATPAELAIFPIHRLVIAVIKARIKQIGRPVYTDMGGPTLIVWAVESYPGSHQFRMPNGDLLN